MTADTANSAAAESQPERDKPEEEDTNKAHEELALEEDILLHNLVILPPRQRTQSSSGSKKGHLALPPLRSSEPVQSLRGALSEVVGYAHLTNFRLELEELPPSNANGDKPSSSNDPPLVISPFTGKDAVISVPSQMINNSNNGAAAVLDEFGDLMPLLDRGMKDGSAIRVVLERYDAASVRDHVARLRLLLDGNAPNVKTLVEESSKEEDEEPQETQGTTPPTAEKKPLPELKRYELSDSIVVDGNNLKDYFYLALGEDPNDFQKLEANSKSLNHKKKKNKSNGKHDDTNEVTAADEPQLVRQNMSKWNELEEMSRVKCVIRHSGFHPPPAQRRLLGDIAYFTVTMLGTDEVLQITAANLGFYVNRTSNASGFDPAPAAEAHFSHSLLDCLLSASSSFCEDWTKALDAAEAKAEMAAGWSHHFDSSLFRVVTRGDFDGFKSAATAFQATSQALDASLMLPCWLSPNQSKFEGGESSWSRNHLHPYNPHRAEQELQNTFGIDVRNGAIRDWNEELQLAREMPTTTLPERLERARLIHKIMAEFGEASLVGVKAIADGQVSPMNPNEPARSQVYLHNNIFFSRGVDAGPETFKIARGDRAARKSANRDVQCIGTFHRMEKVGLHTLATVLIDFLGTRYVCQSILPGILIGEKSHTLLYGSVETGIPLKWDEDLHRVLEEKVGEAMMVATRPVFRMPLTAERMEEIKELKKASPLLAESEKKIEEAQEGVDINSVIQSCVPVEAKGILGSDQRRYVLDFSRLTPRDANWVPQSQGGTGKFEEEASKRKDKAHSLIPSTLDDDEWVMNVLRPELVSHFSQFAMAKHLSSKKKKDQGEQETSAKNDEGSTELGSSAPLEGIPDSNDKKTNNGRAPGEGDKCTDAEEAKLESESEAAKLSKDDLDHLKSLKLNINVFLPHLRSFEGVDSEMADQLKSDEQRAREAAIFLWDEVLPKVTRFIKARSIHQLPVDGKTLTDFLHRNGVNCRYLGRLAELAKEQEDIDAKTDADLEQGTATYVERRTMPKFWLELLECEMVARAAKHVLDDYLTERGCVAATQPAQTVASFLSALVSSSEETAAQTETRLEKRSPLQPDDEDFGALTICDVGGDGDAVPSATRSRSEVWHDIASEVSRRFRYSLTLYNNVNKAKRALFLPLLRRVCQRVGVKLLAKQYDLGARCFCGGSNSIGGQLALSHPISPLDIVDILPLMKHSAAYGEGFTPCNLSPSASLPPLQVSLQDARAALERAHIQTNSRELGKGLELAQEAAALYQRVTDNAAHPGVVESAELMTTIFLEAGDAPNAVASGYKVLGLALQSSGLDSAAVFSAQSSLFQLLFTTHEFDAAAKHLRAAIYLLEIMAGPHHVEHYTSYHKLGTVYTHSGYKEKYLETALEFFREASMRESGDRLVDGFIYKNFSKVLEGLQNYKDALEYEKKAFRTLSLLLGKDHQLTKESDELLKKLTKLAVEKGNSMEAKDKLREQAARADMIAADLVAEEEKRSKKHNRKKKKGKK